MVEPVAKRSLLSFITNNWQRKLFALFLACSVWAFTNQTINETKELIGVPIRIVNLPSNRTIEGILPNGILGRRVNISVTGSKHLLERLTSDDLEITLDASTAPAEWLVHITKKNLTNLNPEFNLKEELTSVSNQDFIINLQKLVTADIPVTLNAKGNLPRNFMYLGIWPLQVTQTVSGPEEQIERLKLEGFELTFDLSDISRQELIELKPPKSGSYSSDVVAFAIPDKWKRVYIPFLTPPWQQINDPAGETLWIEFLKKRFHPINRKIPVRVYYPMQTSDSINPETYPLATNSLIAEKDGIYYLNRDLYAYEVSFLFLENVRNSMEIAIIADGERRENLKWSVEVMDTAALEENYIDHLSEQFRENIPGGKAPPKSQEEAWRNRFRGFMQNIALFVSPNHRLELTCRMKEGQIVVEEER